MWGADNGDIVNLRNVGEFCHGDESPIVKREAVTLEPDVTNRASRFPNITPFAKVHRVCFYDSRARFFKDDPGAVFIFYFMELRDPGFHTDGWPGDPSAKSRAIPQVGHR